MGTSVNVRQPAAARSQSIWAWLPQLLLLGYLAVTLVTFMLIPFPAFSWVRAPYTGVLTGPGLYVLDLPPTSSAYQQGLRLGDRIVALDGKSLTSTDAYQAALERAAGKTVRIEARNAGGQALTLNVQVGAFPAEGQLTYMYIPFLAGLIYLASAVWTFAVRRARASGQILVLFATSVAILAAGLFDLYTSQRLTGLWLIALSVATGSVFSLGLLFPSQDPRSQRFPAFHPLVFALSLVLGLNSLLRYEGVLDPGGFLFALQLQLALAAAAFLFLTAWTLLRRNRSLAAIERDQLLFTALGALVSFGPLLLWVALTPILNVSGYPNSFVILPLAIFPLVIGYTIQRYRLQQTDYVLSRGMLYGLLSVLITVGYALLISGIALLLGHLFTPLGPLAAGLAFFLLALLFNPLRAGMQRMVDSVFFRGQGAYQERLQAFSSALTRSVDLRSILKTLRGAVQESMLPAHQHIFVYDPLSEQFAATPGADRRPTSDLRFPANSPFINLLTAHRGPLILPEQNTIPANLASEMPRIGLLGAEIFIPLPGREHLAGWLALGQRMSGEPYNTTELIYLESLCDQAAVAIERAQMLGNMENRVRQMNVLARVAQGVNITLAMDDMLELIYAQTTSVVPADEFHLMLFDPALDTYQYVFFLEGDERLTDQENKAVSARSALEQEVIRTGKALRTDDYNRECTRQMIASSRPGLFSWMGIPLNAGAETIGALSLGNRDGRVQYTAEQQDLGQAIADQVAGAIVKARLLQETERRALQLTTLNEVTRQLTSTLELEPLLQNILQSACDILSCEAGSLLLVDETTDELVFRVVVSPVASDLVNHRLPPGVGVGGKAVKTREPMIVNDVSRYPDWFSQTDRQTGFVTRTLLVIPLQVKDRAIGVIEVINKKNGSPFSQDDQDLLSAFASQAAVAIENARLYTMTDQALAARVEELSVMQRIDRELNTSLDIATAMRITLEWAMRQSGVQAGLIGTVGENAFKVMASNGYSGEMEEYKEGQIPLNALALEETVQAAAPIRRSLTDNAHGLLQNARSQAVIPIRRETATIGLLLLESADPIPMSEDHLNFLLRLCDHASIAIFNSQLYAAVQSADLAKSEFVSLVAHELKNPMTSVKGYTELLATGAVGPINENQTNFLNTIRSNIERMNTLVSDLNDMSKIEVGRMRLDFKPIQLPDAIENVIRSTRRQIDEKQLTLTLELPDALPPAWADRTRLEQVLVNLVSNATKYTQAGGEIWVSAEKAANEWNPSGAPEVLHIRVRDNGIGISEEDQKKIFQKFFRSEDPKTREAPGTGLGLNITRSLVEMQGGQIWFESVYRQGTTFHFTIPISAG